MFYKYCCLIFFILKALPSWAELKLNLVPYVAYEYSEWTQEYGVVVNRDITIFEATGNAASFNFGSKLYYKLGGPIIGVDFSKAKGKWDYFQAPSSLDNEWREISFEKNTLYAFAGWATQYNKYSFWAGKSLIQDINFKENFNPQDSPLKYSGRSMIYGVATNYDEFLRFELEYQVTQFNKVKRQGGSEHDLPYLEGRSFYYRRLNHYSLIFRLSLEFTVFDPFAYSLDWIWRNYFNNRD